MPVRVGSELGVSIGVEGNDDFVLVEGGFVSITVAKIHRAVSGQFVGKSAICLLLVSIADVA
jgi:hypothetical protein